MPEELLGLLQIESAEWKNSFFIIFESLTDELLLSNLKDYLRTVIGMREGDDGLNITTTFGYKLSDTIFYCCTKKTGYHNKHAEGCLLVTINNNKLDLSRLLTREKKLIDKYIAAVYKESAQLWLIEQFLADPKQMATIKQEIAKVSMLCYGLLENYFPNGGDNFLDELIALQKLLYSLDVLINDPITTCEDYLTAHQKIQNTKLKLNLLPSTLDMSNWATFYDSLSNINIFYGLASLLETHVNTLIFIECGFSYDFTRLFTCSFPKKVEKPIKLVFTRVSIAVAELGSLLTVFANISSVQVNVILHGNTTVSIEVENSIPNIPSKLIVKSDSPQKTIKNFKSDHLHEAGKYFAIAESDLLFEEKIDYALSAQPNSSLSLPDIKHPIGTPNGPLVCILSEKPSGSVVLKDLKRIKIDEKDLQDWKQNNSVFEIRIIATY